MRHRFNFLIVKKMVGEISSFGMNVEDKSILGKNRRGGVVGTI